MQILKLLHLNPNDYKKYVCWELSCDKKDKCWRDAQTLDSHKINPRHGERVGIEIGNDVLTKNVRIISDIRDLSKIWDIDAATTDSSVTISGNGLNPYISQELGQINVNPEITYSELRESIHKLAPLNKDVKSSKYLLL
eukprot:261629_1